MADVSIVASEVASAPQDYTLPGAQEILLRAVGCTINGTNASGSFLPALQMLDPAGHVMFTCVNASDPVAAGGSALVSWFPGGGVNSGSGITQAIQDLESTSGSISITAPEGPLTNVDVSPSGVTASTYGDSTHVGQFTVGADGRVTSASSVAISASSGVSSLDTLTGAISLHAGTNIAITDNSPGAGQINIATSGGSGLVKIFDSTLGVAGTTIDTGAGGIPGGHADLIVLLVGRTTQAVVNSAADFTINNDTAAHYDYGRIDQTGATITGSDTVAQTSFFGWIDGASADANYPGVLILFIPSYDQTTFFKVGTVFGGSTDFSTNGRQAPMHFGWRSTAAITRFTATADAASNFVAGSRMVIYGTQ